MSAAASPELLPRDVRAGATWSQPQRLKNDLLFLAARGLLALASRHDADTLARWGRALGRTLHFLLPRARSVARAQLAAAFPGEDARARARDTFAAMGARIGEAVATLATPPALLELTPNARSVLDAALAEGGGVVLVSAHLGPFERVARTLAAHAPLTVVTRESYDPRFDALYTRLRPYRTLPRGAKGAGVRMFRVLKTGGVLGIPMDLRTRAPSVGVRFLGQDDVPMASGPARLSLRTGAACVVATAAPTPDGDLVVDVARIDRPHGGGDPVVLLTQAFATALEARIRAIPTEWPWMHARHGHSNVSY